MGLLRVLADVLDLTDQVVSAGVALLARRVRAWRTRHEAPRELPRGS